MYPRKVSPSAAPSKVDVATKPPIHMAAIDVYFLPLPQIVLQVDLSPTWTQPRFLLTTWLFCD